MEGKRFGVGLAAGLLVGLALVGASGGLGATPFASLSGQGRAALTPAASSTSTSTIIATSTMTVTSAVPTTGTYSVTSTTSTGGSPIPPLEGNLSSAYTSSSTTTFTIMSTSVGSTPYNTPSNQSAANNANGGTTYGALTPAGNHGPTRLTNIAQQPIVSNAEILVPVLVAFLLGAFLYRVTVKEREGSDTEV